MYLLDANVFIEAKNRYYGFDFAPGFWEWLDADADADAIGSIEDVGRELTRGADELAQWARARPSVFQPLDTLTASKLVELSVWANGAGYTRAAVDEFLRVADYQLVAYAATHGHVVVTHELFQADARRRILIPNACEAMGVTYCNTFSMLRERSVQFGLLASRNPET